jgi:hypothetical protein
LHKHLLVHTFSKAFSHDDIMPDELDVRDDREDTHEEGGDDEVRFSVVRYGRLGLRATCSGLTSNQHLVNRLI